MNKIRTLLVDDEESARNVLSNLLQRFCPDVEIIATCGDLETAVEAIKTHQPALVFLDIEMPNYAGYEIVHFFDTINFDIVFVTAYDQYALRAFEISAVDYLLKPVDIERLQQTVARVKEGIDLKNALERYALLEHALQTNEVKSIIVSEKGYQEVVQLDEIIAIEAQESYSFIYTLNGKKFVASKNLKHFERILSENKTFIRVHKSWLVNLTFIVNYSKSELSINLKNNIVAKLSKYKKGEFEAALLA